MHTLSLSRSLFSGDSPYHIPSVNDQPMHYEFGVSCLGVAKATDTPVRSPSFHDWPKSEGRCLFHQCFVQRDLHSHHTFVTTMVLHLYLYCLPWCLSTAHWRFESMRLLWHLEKKIISLSIFYIYMYFLRDFRLFHNTDTEKSTLLIKRLFSWKMGIVIYVLAICVECISDVPFNVNCLSFPRVAQPCVLPVYTYESGLVDVFFLSCRCLSCRCLSLLLLSYPCRTLCHWIFDVCPTRAFSYSFHLTNISLPYLKSFLKVFLIPFLNSSKYLICFH